MNQKLLKQLRKILLIAMDVDGVLTDGSVLINENGKLLRTMNIKDGYAINRAITAGLEVAIISGGKSEGVKERLKSLGVKFIYLNSQDKEIVLNKLSEELNFPMENILFIGDDLPDYSAMKMSGIRTCPADAVHEIQQICDYISPYAGGKGCVRDIVEKVMRVQGKWK